jgi:hypothetical protein
MALANACPKIPGLTRMEEREARKAQAEADLRACYAKVDRRDHKVCRVSGVTLTAGDSNPRKRLERHHMVERSLDKTKINDPANVITVSAWVHDQLTAHRLHLEGDADARDESGKLCGVLLSANGETGWQPMRMV